MAGPVSAFLDRRIKQPLLAQLRQGVTPEKLALSCALGAVIGVFPILGSTTVLGLLVGYFLRLNHIALQIANQSLYALQLILLPVFVRAGERLFGAAPVPLNPVRLTRDFFAGPALFLERFGMAGLHGIAAWTLAAAPVAAGIYITLRPLFQKVAPKPVFTLG